MYSVVAFALLLVWFGFGSVAYGQNSVAVRDRLGVAEASPPILQRRAGLSVHDATLELALTRLTESSGVVVAFSPSLLRAAERRVSCDCAGATVAETLDRLLEGTLFWYSVMDGQVVLTPKVAPRVELLPPSLPGVSATAASDLLSTHWAAYPLREPPRAPILQQAFVAGLVMDARTLEPLAGAQIVIEGTDQGALTDARGRFRIQNVGGTEVTLRVVLLGYRTLTQSVRVGDPSVRIALEQTAIELDEVVVTGTPGGQLRRSIGNSVATINGAEALERSAAPTLGNLLNGRAPGVIILPSTGRVGSGPSIRIRGRSTLSLSSEPILYIDGVRVNNDVNSGPPAGGFGAQNGRVASRLDDIDPEDIERIEIIKGPAAATIYGTEAANGVIQIVTKKGAAGESQWTARVQQGTAFFQDAEERIPTNYFRNPQTGTIEAWNPIAQESARGTPIFNNAHSQAYSLSLSGSRDQMSYYVSGTYDDQEGVEPNNWQKRFSGHANLRLAPTDNLDVSTSLHVVRSSADFGVDVGTSAMLGALYGHPLLFPANRGFIFFPPELPQQLMHNLQDINRYTGGVTVNHRPAKWLAQRLTLGLDFTSDDSRALEQFAPPDLAPFWASLGPANALGRIAQRLRNESYLTGDYSGTATFSLTPSLSSASSIGGQFVRKQLKSSQLGGRRFPAPGVETVSGTALPDAASQSVLVNTTVGVYAQQQFGYNERLFLTGAVRVDNNSAFGEDFDFVTYPKLSLSWVMSEEPWWRWGNVVDALKLRAAYGQSGQQPDAFAALRTLSSAARANGEIGVTPGSFGNPDLKPERGTELEVGFEAGLFDRLSLDFTYFNKRTKDAILQRQTAPSFGFPGNQFVNIGETSNRGFELQAGLQVLRQENFAWEIGGNIGTNEDKIEELGGIPFVGSGNLRSVEGYPISGFWSRRVVSADRDPTTHAITNILCDGGPGGEPVPCAQAALIFIGTQTPKAAGAISSTFTIRRRLTLYGLVDFKTGHKRLNSNEFLRCGGFVPVCEAIYFPEGYSTEYLASIVRSSITASVFAPFIQDASFAKLREVSATYQIPDRWLGWTGASRAALTVAGRNLAIWTDYNGIDPEAGGVGDQAVLPQLTQFVATLNLTF